MYLRIVILVLRQVVYRNLEVQYSIRKFVIQCIILSDLVGNSGSEITNCHAFGIGMVKYIILFSVF